MGKFYKAGQGLEDYLLEVGFTAHSRAGLKSKEDSKYFTEHKTGKQVRIDYDINFITFLDEKGNFVDESSVYTDNQINNFIGRKI